MSPVSLRCSAVLGGATRISVMRWCVLCRLRNPRKSIKKKQVVHAVVVRQKKPFRRGDGTYISFNENAVVIVDRKKKEPQATRIFGPVPREMERVGYRRIASMAPEVV